MTKRSLDQIQVKLVETIEDLGFARIEQIPIRDGKPCLELATEIVQEIKLGLEKEPRTERLNLDLTLKIEFERLFNQLSDLREGIVDIEVRHGVPFKLVVKRRGGEMLG